MQICGWVPVVRGDRGGCICFRPACSLGGCSPSAWLGGALLPRRTVPEDRFPEQGGDGQPASPGHPRAPEEGSHSGQSSGTPLCSCLGPKVEKARGLHSEGGDGLCDMGTPSFRQPTPENKPLSFPSAPASRVLAFVAAGSRTRVRSHSLSRESELREGAAEGWPLRTPSQAGDGHAVSHACAMLPAQWVPVSTVLGGGLPGVHRRVGVSGGQQANTPALHSLPCGARAVHPRPAARRTGTNTVPASPPPSPPRVLTFKRTLRARLGVPHKCMAASTPWVQILRPFWRNSQASGGLRSGK